MKAFLFSAIMFMSVNSALACLGEAQIRAKVSKIQKSLTSCRVFVDPSQVAVFFANQYCPLHVSQIASQGIEVGLKDGHDCAHDFENDVNGIVFVNGYGTIELEK